MSRQQVRRLRPIRVAVAILVLALVPLTSAAAPPPDLSYTFRIRTPDPGSGRIEAAAVRRIQVQMEVDGGPEGFTVLGLCLTSWPGLEDCGAGVLNLHVRSGEDGRLLPLEQVERTIWIVDHPPGHPLSVTWDLVDPAPSASQRAFRPSVGSEGVFFLADTALLAPEHLTRRGPVEVRFEWVGPTPPGWTPVGSFGAGARAGSVRLPLPRFLHSLFYLGPATVDEATPSTGGLLRVAWLGQAPAATLRKEVLDRLVAARTALAGVAPEIGEVENFLVAPEESPAVSAVSLANSVLFFRDDPAVSRSAEDSEEGILSVAHELVHATPRYSIELTEAPVPSTFWTEAAAELVARRALLRAGLLRVEDWSRVLSEKLAGYGREYQADGSRIDGGGVDSYSLGDLLLVWIDRQLGRNSGDRRGVDELFLRLRERANGGDLSWAAFLEVLGGLESPDFAALVDDVVNQRRRFRLPEDAFEGCLRVQEIPLRSFDPGFDTARSFQQKSVVGVKEGGPAWNAGVRDGQELLEWSIVWNRSHTPVRLVLSHEGKRRTVFYLPEGGDVVGTRQVVSPERGGRCAPLW